MCCCASCENFSFVFICDCRPFAQDIITRCEAMLGVKSEPKRSNRGRRDQDDDLKNFKFPTQTFDRSEIDKALDRGYAAN